MFFLWNIHTCEQLQTRSKHMHDIRFMKQRQIAFQKECIHNSGTNNNVLVSRKQLQISRDGSRSFIWAPAMLTHVSTNWLQMRGAQIQAYTNTYKYKYRWILDLSYTMMTEVSTNWLQMRGAQLLLAIMIDGMMLHCTANGYITALQIQHVVATDYVTALQIQHVVANGYTALQIRHVMKALQCIASYIVMYCGAFIIFICVHPILWYIQLFDTSLLCSIYTNNQQKTV